jgi:hypothetical protein
VTGLEPAGRGVDDRGMGIEMTLAFALIGLAAVGAGAVGMRLPAGDRLAAALPLVVGAGVGVIALAVGAQIVGEDPEDLEALFLVASGLGFAATIASLLLLWRWSAGVAGSARG